MTERKSRDSVLPSEGLFAWGAIALTFVILAWRQAVFVGRYAVNVMYWDQWSVFEMIVRRKNLWESFDSQFGPHRMGIGIVLTKFVAGFTDFDSRWDAYVANVVVIVAAFFGLILARKCGAKNWALLGVPFIFFTIRQYEVFVGATDLSHGTVPLLLIVLLALSWFVRRAAWRYTCIATLSFLAIFTGFSLFAGFVVPFLIGIDCRRHWRDRAWGEFSGAVLALTAVAMSWAVFAHGYVFSPAVEGFHFPDEKPIRYVYFVSGMFNNFFGLGTRPFSLVYLGIFLTFLHFWLLITHGRILLRGGEPNNTASRTIFFFSAFTLAFCFSTAAGRMVLGWHEASATSRYVPLMIPGALALLIHFSGLKRPFATVLTSGYIILLALTTVTLSPAEAEQVRWCSEGKKRWASAYLACHDEAQANRIAKIEIANGSQSELLKYLEQHKLNMFKNAQETGGSQ